MKSPAATMRLQGIQALYTSLKASRLPPLHLYRSIANKAAANVPARSQPSINPHSLLWLSLYRSLLRQSTLLGKAAQDSKKSTVEEIDAMFQTNLTQAYSAHEASYQALGQYIHRMRKQLIVEQLDNHSNAEPQQSEKACEECLRLQEPCAAHNVDTPPYHYLSSNVARELVRRAFRSPFTIDAENDHQQTQRLLSLSFDVLRRMSERTKVHDSFPKSALTKTYSTVLDGGKVSVAVKTSVDEQYHAQVAAVTQMQAKRSGKTQQQSAVPDTENTDVKPDSAAPALAVVNSQYRFKYHITITNHSQSRLKLTHRAWWFVDEKGVTVHITGEGVVGKQPTLIADQSYEYTSFVQVDTPTAFMYGHFVMHDFSQQKDCKVHIQPTLLRWSPKLNDSDSNDSVDDNTSDATEVAVSKQTGNAPADEHSGSNMP